MKSEPKRESAPGMMSEPIVVSAPVRSSEDDGEFFVGAAWAILITSGAALTLLLVYLVCT